MLYTRLRGGDVLNSKVSEIIDRFRRTPFVHNGRSASDGVDCLGFIVLFYKEFGIELPSDDGKFVEEDWYLSDPSRYIRGLRNLGYAEVAVDDLKPLDLVFFVVNHDVITHSGIMLFDNLFVHMTPKKGLRVSKLERHWRRRVRGGIRVLE